MGSGFHHAQHPTIHQLERGRSDSLLRDRHHGVGGVLNGVEDGQQRGHSFRQPHQPDGDLGGNAQSPLRADKEAGKIVSAEV